MAKLMRGVLAVGLVGAAACGNGGGSGDTSGSGSTGQGSTWECRTEGRGCFCGTSLTTGTKVTSCNSAAVGGPCYTSNGGTFCNCYQFGCDSADPTISQVCDCGLTEGQADSGLQTCSPPQDGFCCLGVNLGDCTCYGPGAAGCGNAPMMASCDISQLRGIDFSSMEANGQAVADCAIAPTH